MGIFGISLYRIRIQVDFLLDSCLIFKLLADGEKLLAIDSEGVLWYFSSLNGAACVQEPSFNKGGCSKFSSMVYAW